ncbi:hypothetical protein P692DRAFT_20729881 [Suillus brevipes Sb2]|nr:hypothetical protein P692DRAFT_20729881 [Suillus brevipes Sb2]
MNPFKKMFQKSDDDKTLKHSQSMPYLLSLEGRTRDYRPDSSRPAYRGKTPLKKSDIVYVEQAPGVLETHHGKPSQYTHHHRPTRANFEERPDLLAKFPHSPAPTEGLPRSGFRAISLNSNGIRPQVPVHNPKRIHTTSSNSRSYTPAPPIPTTHGPRPMISRSAHSSRVNLRRVPSHTAILVPAAPDHGHPSRPQRDYREFLNEQDPNILRRMINEFPVAPLCTERTPAQLRPIRFDMVDSRDFQKTFRESLETAIAQGRPLDARAGGPYRRIIDVTDILDIVLETGRNRSRVRHR